MNETQPPTIRTPETQTPEAQTPETQSIAKQKSLADRILAYCVGGSLLINLGWLAWVSNSDLFGGAANLADLKPQLIKIVKPPIPQKPKPKKKEPPPPPPKQKPPPKVKPLRPPPPHPRPQTPRPAPLHRVAVASTKNVHAVSTFTAPPTEQNTTVGTPTASGTSEVVTPPAPPQPPTPTPPPPAPPSPPPPPAPPPVKHVEEVKPPPPPPPPPPRPRNYSAIASQEAEPIGGFGQVDMPSGVDAGQLTSTTITISYEVDEDGHASKVRVRKGSGNADLDDACKEVVRRQRFRPAIQDHLKLRVPGEYTFNVG